MVIFKDNSTLLLVQRAHEINAEAIDNLITMVSDDIPCYVLLHKPNDTWTYDVFIISEKPAEYAYAEAISLGMTHPVHTPKIFYAAICKTNLEEYIERTKYKITNRNVVKPIQIGR